MRLYKKILLSGALIACSLTLTSCYSKEYKEIKNKASKIAEQYVSDKYDEELKIDKVIADSAIGFGLPAGPSGSVIVYDYDKDYSVYVNFRKDKENPLVGDNKQLKNIKEDIKEKYLSSILTDLEHTIVEFEVYGTSPYIAAQPSVTGEYFTKDAYYEGNIEEFLNQNDVGIYLEVYLKSNEEFADNNFGENIDKYIAKFQPIVNEITNDFKGNHGNLHFLLYKPDKYMNEDVKAVLDKRPSYSSSDGYIYSDEYVYLSVNGEKKEIYNAELNRMEVKPWTVSYNYDTSVKIDKGLYASSLYDKKFENSKDVKYNKHSLYEFRTNPMFWSKEDLNNIDIDGVLETDNLTSKGEKVISNVYDIYYNEDVYENPEEGIDIKINKEEFEDGVLLDNKYSIGIISNIPDGSISIRQLGGKYTRDYEKTAYIRIEKNDKLVIYEKASY